MSNSQYSSALPEPEHGDVIAVDWFRSYCKAGVLIDNDGFGHPAKGAWMDESVEIRPSRLKAIPEDATHVVWFNK